ncbi:MAG: CoA-binding protein [Candidatus Bathyarchaeota archaeon]|nr:CoA-binding protein [Candidatus Bathyarchaeota archaeon]
MSKYNTKEILTKHKTVAVVGLSKDPSKDSYRVAEYLKNHDFHIIPVNPFAEEILGEKSYKSLSNIPVNIQKTVEIVDIFRPSADVLPIVEQAIQLKKMHGVPHVVWMQLGIINEQAAEKARKAGLTVIMDKCMMQEHLRLIEKRRLT